MSPACARKYQIDNEQNFELMYHNVMAVYNMSHKMCTWFRYACNSLPIFIFFFFYNSPGASELIK